MLVMRDERFPCKQLKMFINPFNINSPLSKTFLSSESRKVISLLQIELTFETAALINYDSLKMPMEILSS